jgi:hypothetical protein
MSSTLAAFDLVAEHDATLVQREAGSVEASVWTEQALQILAGWLLPTAFAGGCPASPIGPQLHHLIG